jgi:transposase
MTEADLDFIRTKTTKEIVERFGIAAKTVYRWRSALTIK